MRRLLQSFALLALAAVCLGCPMPQTGLDYCSPTVDANGVPTGGFMMRQGSVLGGMPGVPMYVQQPTPARPEGVPTPAEGVPTPAEAPLARPVSATAPAGQPHLAEPAVAEEPTADMAE
jgi:hypothetical protein